MARVNNDSAAEQAINKLRRLIHESSQEGWFGKVGIEIGIQNGSIANVTQIEQQTTRRSGAASKPAARNGDKTSLKTEEPVTG